MKGQFGFLPYIVGTIEVTAIAMILSIPMCLLSAIYLSEYAHRRFRELVRLVVDILAGIPSVIYGLCGVIAVVPFVHYGEVSSATPQQATAFCREGIILALMVAPRNHLGDHGSSGRGPQTSEGELPCPRDHEMGDGEVRGAQECASRHYCSHCAGVCPCLRRDHRCTDGDRQRRKDSDIALRSAYPLPALIANNYGEMMSIPLYDSALLFASLILLFLVGAFSLGAHITLSRLMKRGFYGR